MIDLIIAELTRLGVTVVMQPETLPSHLTAYMTPETNALYVKHLESHAIYLFGDTDLHILAHEAIHFLQNRAKATLVFCTEDELVVAFPKYWKAVCRAYKKATRKELLQETEAHVFQQYPQLVIEELQKC